MLLFGLADAADYAEAAGAISGGLGWRGAIALLVLMISMIGGRIIPSFTQELAGQERIIEWPPFAATELRPSRDRWHGALAAVLAAFPNNRVTGLMLVLAAVAQALRLSRWRGYRTWPDPLVLILHVGYAWVPLGLLLLGLSVGGIAIPRSAGVHALTAGAMATMILAVMTRASLGHTGRELKASPITVLAYSCLTIGALLRVATSLGVGPYLLMIYVAGASWGAALVLFLIVYSPVLWGPRPGEHP